MRIGIAAIVSAKQAAEARFYCTVAFAWLLTIAALVQKRRKSLRPLLHDTLVAPLSHDKFYFYTCCMIHVSYAPLV